MSKERERNENHNIPETPKEDRELFLVKKKGVAPNVNQLCFCFVFNTPHISEIIGYLSSSDWLISLSISLSGSIHIEKGRQIGDGQNR